jgi:hypothetical protein
VHDHPRCLAAAEPVVHAACSDAWPGNSQVRLMVQIFHRDENHFVLAALERKQTVAIVVFCNVFSKSGSSDMPQF